MGAERGDLPGVNLIVWTWRPEPESNRRARICSPLRNHSAIGPDDKNRMFRAAFQPFMRFPSGLDLATLPPNGNPELRAGVGWQGGMGERGGRPDGPDSVEKPR